MIEDGVGKDSPLVRCPSFSPLGILFTSVPPHPPPQALRPWWRTRLALPTWDLEAKMRARGGRASSLGGSALLEVVSGEGPGALPWHMPTPVDCPAPHRRATSLIH